MPTWLSRQQILRFDARDLRHGGEDVCTGCCRAFDTVTMVDLPVTRFLVKIELNEIQTMHAQREQISMAVLTFANEL